LVLARCSSENIVFQRGGTGSTDLATAYARLVTLPPYRSSEQFAAAVRAVAGNAQPQGFVLGFITVTPTTGTSVPCTDFELTASSKDVAYRALGRFCYVNRESTLGIATLFSQLGSRSENAIRTEATGFIAGASPK